MKTSRSRPEQGATAKPFWQSLLGLLMACFALSQASAQDYGLETDWLTVQRYELDQVFEQPVEFAPSLRAAHFGVESISGAFSVEKDQWTDDLVAQDGWHTAPFVYELGIPADETLVISQPSLSSRNAQAILQKKLTNGLWNWTAQAMNDNFGRCRCATWIIAEKQLAHSAWTFGGVDFQR